MVRGYFRGQGSGLRLPCLLMRNSRRFFHWFCADRVIFPTPKCNVCDRAWPARNPAALVREDLDDLKCVYVLLRHVPETEPLTCYIDLDGTVDE